MTTRGAHGDDSSAAAGVDGLGADVRDNGKNKRGHLAEFSTLR